MEELDFELGLDLSHLDEEEKDDEDEDEVVLQPAPLTPEEKAELLARKDEIIKDAKEYIKSENNNTTEIAKLEKNDNTEIAPAKITKSKLTNIMAEFVIRYYDILVIYPYTGSPANYYLRRTLEGNVLPYYYLLDETQLKILVDYFMTSKKDIHRIDNIGSYLDDQLVSKVTNFITTHAAIKTRGITPDNTLVHIAPVLDEEGEQRYGLELYWSRQNGLVMKTAEDANSGAGVGIQEKCFRHFCHSNTAQSGVVHIDHLDGGIIEEYAERAEREFAQYNKEITAWEQLPGLQKETTKKPEYPQRFDTTYGVWCNGNNDLYVDMLKLSMLPLLKEKPPKIFFLVGNAGGGKSTFRHLLQTIYGTENCSLVGTSKFSDWSYTNTLIGKMLNIPDEDATSDFIDAPEFKSIASHDTVAFKRKGASIPMSIHCDFVNIMPINAIPEWRNMDSGVARRICIVPFYASLTYMDSKVKNFEEETFTPELISQIIGEIIGIASYYTHTGEAIAFSPTVNILNESYNRSHNSAMAFKEAFEQHFDSFSAYSLLYEEYQRWCTYNEYDISAMSVFKVAFNDYEPAKVTIGDGRRTNGYKRSNQRGKRKWSVFYPDAKVVDAVHPKGITVAELAEMGVSSIVDLEAATEEGLK